MKNKCRYQKKITPFIDNALSVDDQQKVQFHLEKCASCRKQWLELKKTDQLLRSLDEIDVSESFDRQFWGKLDTQTQVPPVRSFFESIFTGWRPYAAALSAAAIIVVFSLNGGKTTLTPEQIVIANNIEMLENFELINHLDLLENWDEIKAMDTEPS